MDMAKTDNAAPDSSTNGFARRDIRRCGPEEPWYLEGPDGGVLLREVTCEGRVKLMSASACLALALNELCCERKQGKVYVCGVPNERSASVVEEMPDMLYVPAEWSDRSVAEWKRLSPRERLFRCSARCGWVLNHQPVLPFTLQMCDESKTIPWLSGFARAKVTLILSPLPYIGRTARMRSAFFVKGRRNVNRKREGTPAYTMDRHRYAVDQWEDLDGYKVAGGRGILDRLQGLYEDERHDCLEFWGKLREEMMKLYKQHEGMLPLQARLKKRRGGEDMEDADDL